MANESKKRLQLARFCLYSRARAIALSYILSRVTDAKLSCWDSLDFQAPLAFSSIYRSASSPCGCWCKFSFSRLLCRNWSLPPKVRWLIWFIPKEDVLMILVSHSLVLSSLISWTLGFVGTSQRPRSTVLKAGENANEMVSFVSDQPRKKTKQIPGSYKIYRSMVCRCPWKRDHVALLSHPLRMRERLTIATSNDY